MTYKEKSLLGSDSAISNTLNDAKIVFSFENSVHINSLFNMLEECVLHNNYNNVYTILTLLKERLKPELLEDFGNLFNSLNIDDHAAN